MASLAIALSAVSHLGSAGVSALADDRDRARRQDGECVLVAPPVARPTTLCRSSRSPWSAATPTTSSPRSPSRIVASAAVRAGLRRTAPRGPRRIPAGSPAPARR
ncbi:STAS domain-containing protein [Mycobacterium sp.]|uniref:STAS domain-containing protein n=1 Tax=Mycobacterium sp. TaxID=1785 RepID=UPI0031D7C231